MIPAYERSPTPRERSYLEALEDGEAWPSISGQAGHMCRRFGWCEVIYRGLDGATVRRSALPATLDAIGIVRAGYRAVGYALTPRGHAALGRVRSMLSPPPLPEAFPG